MKRILFSMITLWMAGTMMAQMKVMETMQLQVNTMDAQRQELIAQSAHYQSENRGLGTTVAAAGIAALTDVMLTEIVKLFSLPSEQKKEWHKMIEKECHYKNDIPCLNDVNNFYSSPSVIGSIDPTGFAFDGVTITDSIHGKEVLRIVCHVDLSDDKLETLWRHGTFSLVLDTLKIRPYGNHLPNLKANNIRSGIETKRDNSFHFDERKFFNVAIQLKLTSSWVNQLAQVMQDVQLGEFRFAVQLDSASLDQDSTYCYIRNANNSKPVAVSGCSFIVPRSYIVSSTGAPLWGTGAFKISAEIIESCGFDFDNKQNERVKHWFTDYRQIRKMQKKDSQRVADYFVTLLKQKGGVLVKTTSSTAITGAVGSAMGSATGAAMGANHK